jgi:phosphoglycerate dehydrogenase-like enzyme
VTVARPAPAAVAVLDDYQGVAKSFGPWSRLGDRVSVSSFRDHLDDEDRLVDRLGPFGIVVAMRERTAFDRGVIERLPNLRLLVTTGNRNAVIDLAACTERGVTVCGTGGVVHPTAELTWALILAAARHLPDELGSVRNGGWMTHVGADLHGARLGVLGLGHLGGRVARIGLAFGMDVVAWSHNLTDDRCRAVGATLVSKDELLASADYVTIHLVLSDRTRALIGEDELGRMKPTAWLINTSRGPICDEHALARACASRQIAGACLDAFSEEPLAADHPFRRLPNVLASPHIGYVTEQTYQVFFADVVEDIERWLDGDPVRVVRPD